MIILVLLLLHCAKRTRKTILATVDCFFFLSSFFFPSMFHVTHFFLFFFLLVIVASSFLRWWMVEWLWGMPWCVHGQLYWPPVSTPAHSQTLGSSHTHVHTQHGSGEQKCRWRFCFSFSGSLLSQRARGFFFRFTFCSMSFVPSNARSCQKARRFSFPSTFYIINLCNSFYILCVCGLSHSISICLYIYISLSLWLVAAAAQPTPSAVKKPASEKERKPHQATCEWMCAHDACSVLLSAYMHTLCAWTYFDFSIGFLCNLHEKQTMMHCACCAHDVYIYWLHRKL